MGGGKIGSAVGDLRSAALRRLARILIKSGTFRRHLGAFDRNYDLDFLQAARFLRGASDETVSLNDLLASHGAPPLIDYISIDTEGSELAILEAFDFARWDVRLFSVEHNLTVRQRAIDDLMHSRGYEKRFADYAVIDAWYRKAC